MSNRDMQKIGIFDQVMILTTANVKYLSSIDVEIKPNGVWSVNSVIGDDILCIKRGTIIRIPIADVLKIQNYDLSLSKLGNIFNGE